MEKNIFEVCFNILVLNRYNQSSKLSRGIGMGITAPPYSHRHYFRLVEHVNQFKVLAKFGKRKSWEAIKNQKRLV